jgi:Arc/MetJ-type ribon-helix-helix transcriptional regulator
MAQLTIHFPDPAIKAFLDQVLSDGKYASADDYINSLISQDRDRRKQARLEQLLLEGLEGEPRAMTAQDWDDMRRRYEARA